MQHHNSARYAKHLLSVASSQVILALGHPVMSLIAIAAAITGCNEPVLAHAVPQWFPLLHVPSLPFSLRVPTLASWLVFHTNTCYGTGLIRAGIHGDQLWTEPEIFLGKHWHGCRAQMIFTRYFASWAMLQHFSYCCRWEEDLQMELKGLLQKKELEAVMASLHQPNYVIQIMSVIIQNCSLRNGGSINGFEHYTELSWQSGNMWADTHSFVLHKVDIEVPGNLAHCTAFSFLGSMSLDCYPCYFT